jgi:hypothetical protein
VSCVAELTPEIADLQRRCAESGVLHTLTFERAHAAHIAARVALIAFAEHRDVPLPQLCELVLARRCDLRRVLLDVQLACVGSATSVRRVCVRTRMLVADLGVAQSALGAALGVTALASRFGTLAAAARAAYDAEHVVVSPVMFEELCACVKCRAVV